MARIIHMVSHNSQLLGLQISGTRTPKNMFTLLWPITTMKQELKFEPKLEILQTVSKDSNYLVSKPHFLNNIYCKKCFKKSNYTHFFIRTSKIEP